MRNNRNVTTEWKYFDQSDVIDVASQHEAATDANEIFVSSGARYRDLVTGHGSTLLQYLT